VNEGTGKGMFSGNKSIRFSNLFCSFFREISDF